MLKHRGEKPFICNQCNYKCTQAIDLKRHMLIAHPQRKEALQQCLPSQVNKSLKVFKRVQGEQIKVGKGKFLDVMN